MTRTAAGLAAEWIQRWPELETNPGLLAEFFDADCVYENIPMGFTAIGADEIGARYRGSMSAFSDVDTQVESVPSEGERAAIHWVMSGWMAHDVPGFQATGRRFQGIDGVIMVRARHGGFVKMTKIYDALNCFGQLGILDTFDESCGLEVKS